MNLREFAWKILPRPLKKLRHAYVLGTISKYAEDDYFLYDYRILNKLNMETYSQHGQDAFCLNYVFGGKKEGLFLDIGGNSPVFINNTFLFEKNGWQGFAFEPIKRLADMWAQERKTPCFNLAIGAEKKKVLFSESKLDYMSGIGVSEQISDQYEIQQETITSFLKEKNISKVDMVFIDVEGYEMEVLKGIDFDSIDIGCICIENNRKSDILPDGEMRRYIVSKGYKLIARLTIDDVFVKPELIKE